MDKKWIEKLAVEVVRIMSMIMLTCLFVFSIYNTTFLKDIEEHSFFLEDMPVKQIGILVLMFVLLTGICHVFRKYNIKVKKKWGNILLYASFFCGVLWIFVSQAKPTGDSLFIFDVAEKLSKGDVSAFEKGGYMYVCPNQKGIVLFCYFLQMLAGSNNYLFFQFINVCALTVIQWLLYETVFLLTKDLKAAMLVLLAEICFLPALLYTSFTYGTLIGFAATMTSVWTALMFYEKEKFRYAVISAVAMAFSVLFKSNNLICLIGIVLVAAVYACKKTKWKNILFVICLVAGYMTVSIGAEAIMDRLTDGLSRENTFLASAYITMGMQESTLAPGWFNGYAHEVCINNDFNEDVYTGIVNNDLREQINTFVEEPEYAYDFFAKKLISQWCEPTFQSMWIVLVRESLLEQTSMLRYWMVAPYSGANILLRQVLDIFQSMIYFGALAYVLTEKKKDIRRWTGMVIILGGFLFHMMWEAKSQYTINYFMLMIPYGIMGIYHLINRLAEIKNKNAAVQFVKEYGRDKKRCICMCGYMLLVLGICLFLFRNGVSFANADDMTYYHNFMLYG